MKPCLLMTARHPGPAELLLSAIPELSALAEVHLIATDSALDILLSRGLAVLRNHVRVLWGHGGMGFVRLKLDSPVILPAPLKYSNTQVDPVDLLGATKLLEELQVLFKSFLPDIFLRTTPADAIGVDELAPVALRDCGFLGSIHCLQDYYGVGFALRPDEHRIASVGVDLIATVDDVAARLAGQRTGSEAHSIGWLAFETYREGPRYCEVRIAGRHHLGLAPDCKLVLYAAICSGLPNSNDVRDFEQCLPGLAECVARNSGLRVALKIHPRCTQEEQTAYRFLCEEWGDRIPFQSLGALVDFRELLAAPDVVLSPASAMNLNALAYAATACSLDTQSVYVTGKYARAALVALCGLSVPPTHEPGNGSFIADYKDLGEVLDRALSSDQARKETSARALNLFGPDGSCSTRIAQFLGLATK